MRNDTLVQKMQHDHGSVQEDKSVQCDTTLCLVLYALSPPTLVHGPNALHDKIQRQVLPSPVPGSLRCTQVRTHCLTDLYGERLHMIKTRFILQLFTFTFMNALIANHVPPFHKAHKSYCFIR